MTEPAISPDNGFFDGPRPGPYTTRPMEQLLHELAQRTGRPILPVSSDQSNRRAWALRQEGASYPTPQALAAHAKQHTTATCWCGHVTTAGGIGPQQAGHKRRGETPPDEPAPEPPAPASGGDRTDATVVGLREPCQDCGRRVPTTLIDGERLCQRCGAA